MNSAKGKNRNGEDDTSESSTPVWGTNFFSLLIKLIQSGQKPPPWSGPVNLDRTERSLSGTPVNISFSGFLPFHQGSIRQSLLPPPVFLLRNSYSGGNEGLTYSGMNFPHVLSGVNRDEKGFSFHGHAYSEIKFFFLGVTFSHLLTQVPSARRSFL